MPDLLLAEELLLLALDDAKGTTGSGMALDSGLAGAVLLDLIGAGAVSVSPAGGGLEVDRGADPPSDPLLAAALGTLGDEPAPKPVMHWVGRLPQDLKPLKGRVADGLVARGVLGEERHKTLGLISSTRYPCVDPRPEQELRRRLEATLLDGADPTPGTPRLVALISAVGLVGSVVPKDQRQAAKERAAAIAETSAVGAAVERAVAEIRTAVAIGATSGAMAASSTS